MTEPEHPNNPNHETPATAAPSRAAPRVVGLAGGIASGKSAVAGMLADLGAALIDADEIAHRVLESPEVCRKLREEWGDAPFDANGRPDRSRIARIVFRHPEKLDKLNGWVHPPVRKEMRAQLERARRDSSRKLIVIDAPLLIEAGLDRWCDVVLFVESDIETRDARARRHRGWAPGELAQRERRQHDLAKKRKRADAIINNNRSREETLALVKPLFREWTGPQTRPPSRPKRSGGRSDG